MYGTVPYRRKEMASYSRLKIVVQGKDFDHSTVPYRTIPVLYNSKVQS